MGGAVSSGRDNDELVDNLIDAEYITTKQTEKVFRAVDRGNYYLPEHRSSAYKDGAWRHGNLHLSAPCIYTKVVESLELKPGLSFLNLGSGTGYLSTMIGLMLGSSAINHGVEYHAEAIEYARAKLDEFIENCTSFDEFDFCPPVFVQGNFLKISAVSMRYDRVYCGAGCPEESLDYIKEFLNVGGIAIVPFGDQLLKIKRINETDFEENSLHSVAFASLIPPSPNDDLIDLPEVVVCSLKSLCRKYIRALVRNNIKIWKGELDIRRKKPAAVTYNPDRVYRLIPHPSRAGVQDDEYGDDDGLDDESDRDSVQEQNSTVNNPVNSQQGSAVAIAASAKPDRTISVGTDSGISLGTSVSSSSQSDRTSEDRDVYDCPIATCSLESEDANQQPTTSQSTDTDIDNAAIYCQENPESNCECPSEGASNTTEASPNSESSKRLKEDSGADSDTGRSKRHLCSCFRSNTLKSRTAVSTRHRKLTRTTSENTTNNTEPTTTTTTTTTTEYVNRDGSSQSSSDSSSSDEHDDLADDEAVRFSRRNRQRVLQSLMRALDRSPEPKPLSEEDDRERMYNLNKAKLYHSSFSETMISRINSLPLPPSLKDYLLYYRKLST